MAEEKKNIEEQIDETVAEMKKKIEEISANADKVEGDLSGKAQEVKEKSIDVLNKAIDKVKSIYNDATDPEEVSKTLDFVKAKAKDLGDSATKAFDSFRNKEKEDEKSVMENVTEFTDKVADKVTAVYNEAVDSLKNNESLKDLGDKVSEGYEKVVEGAKDILNKQEVKETIDKVKDSAGDIAEKAVSALKAWLGPEKKEENKDEEPKE